MTSIRVLERLLDEAVMGFLAIVGFAAALAPFAFGIDTRTAIAFDVIQWTVLVAFILEFTVGFIAAPDRSRWIRNPWRIVDLVCILGGSASLLPGVTKAAGGSVALRLLRLGRVVAFGTMVGTTVEDAERAPDAGPQPVPTRVRVFSPGRDQVMGMTSWDEALDWLTRPDDRWFDVTGARRGHMELAAGRLGLPPDLLRAVLDSRAGGRFVAWDGGVAISVWLPTGISEGFPDIRREQLVIFLPKAGILTATLSAFELPGSLVPSQDTHADGRPILGRLLEFGLELHARAFSRLDLELRVLDQTRLTAGNAEFFTKVFRLRRGLAAAVADVGRYSTLVRSVAERAKGAGPDVSRITADLDELTGHFNELKEKVQSLMDLHLNVKSYEVNRFMRFLAVVSFLGLIPSVAGGLLGMNVEGSPWSITLPQVAFIVTVAIAFSLYLFAIRGWLR